MLKDQQILELQQKQVCETQLIFVVFLSLGKKGPRIFLLGLIAWTILYRHIFFENFMYRFFWHFTTNSSFFQIALPVELEKANAQIQTLMLELEKSQRGKSGKRFNPSFEPSVTENGFMNNPTLVLTVVSWGNFGSKFGSQASIACP